MKAPGHGWLSALVGVNMTIGIAAPLLVIAMLGLGAHADVMYASQAVYLVIFSILGAALGSVLTPMMARDFVVRSHVSTLAYMRSLLPTIALTSVLIWSMTDRITPLLFGGLPDDAAELTNSMARTYALVLFVSLVNVVLSSARRARNEYRRVEAAEGIAGLCYLGAIVVLVPGHGVETVPTLALVRAVIASALLLTRDDVLPGAKPARESLLGIHGRLRANIAGFSVVKTGPLLDRHLCARGTEGELALVSLLSAGVATFAGLVERSVLTPHMVRTAGASEPAITGNLLAGYYRSLVPLAALSCAACVLAIATLRPLFEMAMQAGWHNAAGLDEAVRLSVAMSLCLVAGIPGQTAAATLYALDHHGTVSRIAILNFTIASAMKILLFPILGTLAVAIGTVTYQLLNSITLHAAVCRRLATRDD